MTKQYILALDLGTTSSRAFIIDAEQRVLGSAQHEFAQHYPQNGYVEHDALEIWHTCEIVIAGALAQAKISPREIAAIGMTNQRETIVVWDRRTSTPVHRAIVWQDRRTADVCAALRRGGYEAKIAAMSGLLLDPYFSGTKLAWLLDHVDGARARAARGELAAGTIDTWLTWQLTGGASHVTDVSNASRTMGMNLRATAWDAELLDLLHIEPKCLPTITSSSDIVGETAAVAGLPAGIPIASLIGDQQSALFGQACFASGDAKCTYGTGSFLLMNTGEKPVASHTRMLTTAAWKIGNAPCVYALEGSCFIAGAAVQWLRDGLGIITHAHDVQALAASVSDSGGVTFVPALTGLGAPHWRADARGVLHGITRATTAAHIARATLDGIALQQVEVLSAMQKDSGITLRSLKVDGGAAADNLLMQIQADVLGVEIVRPKNIETTVMGAAFLAGLAVGVWKSPEEIAQRWQEDRTFTPQISESERQLRLERWNEVTAKA